MKAPLFRRAREGGVFRISPADTNKFVLAVDPVADGAPFLSVVEIFEVGGRTPPHRHDRAHEMFYVLSGRGRAHCGGKTYEMARGDTLVLPPGLDHVVENTGRRRLYCLTVMLPNEGLAELIRAGQPMALDAADRAVVSAPTRPRSGSSRGRASSRRSPAATASGGRGHPRKGRA